MPAVFAEMLPYLIGAVAVATVGAVLPAFWCPSAHARAHIQHFAAGIVTAAVATEILPEVVNETERPGWILGAFALGGTFMLGLKCSTTDSRRGRERKRVRASGSRSLQR